MTKTNERATTHYEGCWRHKGHHTCAVARCDYLAAEMERRTAELRAAEETIRLQRARLGHCEEARDRLYRELEQAQAAGEATP